MAAKKPVRTPVGDKKPKARPMGKDLTAALQAAAEARFVYNDRGVTLKDLVQQPLFKGVTPSQMSQWAQAGDWLTKRKAYLGSLRAQVEQHISGGLVQQRMDQLRLYDKLHSQLSAYILPDAHGHIHTQPKNFESALMALMKLDEHRAKYRREISDSVGDRVSQGVQAQAPTSPLDPAMAQRMAHAFMTAQIVAEAGPKALEEGRQGE